MYHTVVSCPAFVHPAGKAGNEENDSLIRFTPLRLDTKIKNVITGTSCPSPYFSWSWVLQPFMSYPIGKGHVIS
jgi:hypothetical protein